MVDVRAAISDASASESSVGVGALRYDGQAAGLDHVEATAWLFGKERGLCVPLRDVECHDG